MSYRWFDFSRQIFWDNNNQDLSIPGTLRTSTTQISSLTAINISSLKEQIGALTTSSIGINCNAPAYRLDVNGTGRFDDLAFQNSNNTTAISFDSYNPTSTALAAVYWFNLPNSTIVGNVGNASTFNILGYNGASAFTRNLLAITPNGFIGIGNCNAPQYTLDVNGTGHMTTLIVGSSNLPPVYSTNDHLFVNGFLDVYNTAQASTLIRMAGASGRNYIQSGTASTASAFAPADLIFGSPGAASEYVRFTSTGRVGIGTASPAYTLDILGSNRVRTDYDALTLQGTSIVSSLYINFQKPSMSAQLGWFGNFSQGVTYSSIFGIYTPANTSIAFYTGSATPSIFCSTNSGNVGIGTATPEYKLDVNGITRIGGPGQLWIGNTSTLSGQGSVIKLRTDGTPTAYTAYQIEYNNGVNTGANSNDIRFVGSQDSITQRKFDFGYYTSDNRSNAWNSAMSIASQSKSVILNGAVSMPSFPNNNVLITSGLQQILLSNAASAYMYMQAPGNRIRIGAYSNVGGVPFTINESGGDVGVGCNAPRYNLDLVGNLHISGQYYDDSDQRVKENIVNADTSICYSTMKEINLKYFQWNSNFQSTSILRDRHQLGFLAQEIKQVFPNSVYISSNYGYDDFHGLEMKQINAMHYGATKKLMEIVEQQGSTIQGIQQQLSTLQKS